MTIVICGSITWKDFADESSKLPAPNSGCAFFANHRTIARFSLMAWDFINRSDQLVVLAKHRVEQNDLVIVPPRQPDVHKAPAFSKAASVPSEIASADCIEEDRVDMIDACDFGPLSKGVFSTASALKAMPCQSMHHHRRAACAR
ncbi:hypothetical protein ACK9YZ_32625 [Rhizobium sp. ZK1]|uniref:hypothetical protein n=1 Tax=Rhizobium sp. ZK1 TaxID=3389872 RepID=UPI0039F691BA